MTNKLAGNNVRGKTTVQLNLQELEQGSLVLTF